MTTTTTARRHPINMGVPERVGRGILGALAALLGMVVIAGGAGAWGAFGALLLIAVGVSFVITGVTGYCVLYEKLGRLPRSARPVSR